MKIGIDLDGVVIDSEKTLKTYTEIFDIDTLKGNNLINKEEPFFQFRYNWTKGQKEEFIKKYFLIASKESNLMSGFIAVYNWQVEDKLEICKKENIDIMIDDNYHIIKKLADNKIKTLYFRDTNLIKLKENEYITEVNNWGDIYRIIKNNAY